MRDAKRTPVVSGFLLFKSHGFTTTNALHVLLVKKPTHRPRGACSISDLFLRRCSDETTKQMHKFNGRETPSGHRIGSCRAQICWRAELLQSRSLDLCFATGGAIAGRGGGGDGRDEAPTRPICLPKDTRPEMLNITAGARS